MTTGRLGEAIGHLRGAGLTDGQLLEEYLLRRDEAALAALVRRHGPSVWGVCRRVLGDHHDAEDAFQATFLVLVRRAASIASRERVANWIYGVARQTARKARATAGRRKARERQVGHLPEPAAEGQDPDDVRPLLDDELGRLPPDFRAAVVLCDLEGKTRGEAARELGLPEGTVASRLARGRALLADRLARRGLAPAVPAALTAATIDAAARGVFSANVATLTEGVLKTMMLSKFKAVTAVLFVATTLALTCGMLAGQSPDGGKGKPPGKPAEARKGDSDRLQGAWRLVTAEMDGLRIGEGRPELDGSRIVFEKSSFTLYEKQRYSERVRKETEEVKHAGTFALDGKKDPAEIVLTWGTNPWTKEKGWTGRGIYALEGDTLRLCVNDAREGDGKKAPAEFSAPAGSKRFVWTFRREGAKVEKRLWAAMSVNQPLFREGHDTNLLQLSFALVNESDEVIDPNLPGYPRLVVNGKELDLSAVPFVGPRDRRFRALPAGDNLQFGLAAGRWFEKPGTYEVYWQGEGYRSRAVTFRVLKKP